MKRLTIGVFTLTLLAGAAILMGQSSVLSTNPQVTGGMLPLRGTTGAILFVPDNTFDIGASGATRPKNIYASGNYYGNGATLTGITGATGGVSNTGSTTVASDSDNSGGEDVAVYTSTVARWLVKGGTGHLVPNVSATYSIGTSSTKVMNVYAEQFSNGSALASTLYSGQLASGNKILSSVQASGETSSVSIIDLATTWNNAANTPTAIKLVVTDTASQANSALMDLQTLASGSVFKVGKTGAVVAAGGMYGTFYEAAPGSYLTWAARSKILSPADGSILLQNNAASDFSLLQFGGTSASFPALKRSGTSIDVKLANDSAYASMTADTFTATSFYGTTFLRVGSTAAAAGAVRLPSNSVIAWRNAANSADIGIRVNTSNALEIGTSVLLPDGGSATPALAFASSTNTGIHLIAGPVLRFDAGGLVVLETGAGVTTVPSTYAFGWGLGGPDTLLYRDGAAGVIAQKNSTNAQEFRVYGTTTGPKYLSLKHDGTDAQIVTNNGGLYLGDNNVVRWLISAGNLLANGDTTYDIGASGNYRPRSIYIGTSVIIGTNPASAGAIALANAAAINWRNQANGADIGGWSVNSSNQLVIGNAVTPASSGTRYLCISTTGVITSSASACSGT